MLSVQASNRMVKWLSVSFLAAFTICAWAQVTGFGLSETAQDSGNTTEDLPTDELTSLIDSLELRTRIAQLMFVRLEGGIGLNSEDRALLTHYSPGGVLLPIMTDHKLAAEHVAAIRKTGIEAEYKIPYFIASPLFHGVADRPQRMNVFHALSTPLALGATGDPELAGRFAEVLGPHLKDIGINTILGPSLALAPSLPDANPTLMTFGGMPEQVGNIAAALIASLEEQGLMVAPTEFPGGACERVQNSPGVLLTPRTLLGERDLLPYSRAIEAGVSMILVGNVLTPMLDESGRPAGRNPAVMRLLREELGFNGVIVAGPLDGGSQGDSYSVADVAVDALNAGADMLYWEDGGKRAMRAVEDIAKAVKDDRMKEETINAAVRRVLAVKQDRDLIARELPEGKLSKKTRDLLHTAYEIEWHAVTVVKNDNNILPLSKDRSMPIGVTGTMGVELMHDALEKHIKPVAQQLIPSAKHLGTIEEFEIRRLTKRSNGMRTVVCVFTDATRTTGQRQLIRAFQKQRIRVVVVLVGYPRNLPDLSIADAVVVAYAGGEPQENTMRAVADVLAGVCPVVLAQDNAGLRTVVGRTETLDVQRFARIPSGRLPLQVGEYPAGYFLSYSQDQSFGAVTWSFDGEGKEHGPVVEHTFKHAGDMTLSVTLPDGAGSKKTAEYHIRVEEAPVDTLE